jgi:outer membrane protein assembly factor BamB
MKSFSIKMFLLVMIGGILLSGCAGGPISNSWPGATAGKDLVYLSDQGFVFGIKASDGSMAWRYPADKANATSFYAAPALNETQLVVGDYGTSLYSFDALTGNGKVIFSQSKGRFVASPLIVDKTILAPSADGNLYALDANGTSIWSKPFKTQQSVWAQPVSNGKLVFQVSMDHKLYAINLADGSQVWSLDLGGAAISGPALDANGVLYIGTLASEVLAVNSDSGHVIWRRPSPGTIWGTPVVIGTNLYFGDFSGKATALLAKDGSPVWTIDLTGPAIAPPVQFKDFLVYAMETGDVQAVTIDGKKSWTHKINGKLYSTPVVMGDRLMVPVTQGDRLLVALDTNGNEVWSFVMPK